MIRPVKPSIAMGFYFFPRGGSAQVARYLCRALGSGEYAPTLFAGSMGTPADGSNAHKFFSGIRCHSLDYTSARSEWCTSGDAMASSVPMPASYEDKPGVPDRIFFDLDAAAFDRQVASWTRFFKSYATVAPSLVHLHHLTPMHEAVRAVWPTAAVVTHLHGTELKMLESVDVCAGTAAESSRKRAWVERMRRWAGESDRVVVVAAHDQQLVHRLLPVDPDHITRIANGVDTDVFAPRPKSNADRMQTWKRFLVERPRGWRPSGPEGSIRYQEPDLEAFTDRAGQLVPVVLFAGRFMRFKRLQLLIEAHHALRSTTTCRPVLVVAGGFPGEWEGEHPFDTVQRLGAEGVFFIGWREHDDLSEILSCSDVFAAPSVEEPFGLVYLEAMASGIPPIATCSGGPLSFINLDQSQLTGWLVEPDDPAAITRALEEAVSDRAGRIARGERAAQFVREHYSWSSSAAAFVRLYEAVLDEPRSSPRYE
jgi:glycosyltransferase involved in cell wall biosynthesis